MTAPDPAAPVSIADCLRRDQHRLRRERDRLQGQRMRGTDIAAAEQALQAKIAASAAARARRAATVPALAYPEDLPVSQHRDEIRRAIEEHPVVIVGGRDRLGKDHAAAQDLPRGRPRRRRRHRPHAAAAHRRARGRGAHRRGAQGAARRAGGLQAALPGSQPARRSHQADDRRHPAGRDAGRPLPRPLRHDHRRRGARAFAEHRLPARLPEVAAAAPARI